MADVVLGTANLFAVVDEATSRSVLRAAWDHGIRRFDTAPSYGYGRSEGALAALVSSHDAGVTITTKAGIAASAPAGRAVHWAKSAARRLPQPLQRRLRGDGPPGGGHFAVDEVRASIDRSLSRLPHIDRLLLHEVQPGDITPELLACLRGYRDAGSIGRIGVATANDRTAACLACAPELLTVAHLAVGLHAVVPELGPQVLVVGHGALGPGGSDLRALTTRLAAGTTTPRPAIDPVGLLIARALGRGPAELIVATSRPERVTQLAELVAAPPPIDSELGLILDELAAAAAG